jgi:hypothetical protein
VRANREGISIEGRARIDRAAIRDGLVVPRLGAKPLVRLRLRRLFTLPIELEVESEAEGRKLLHAMGLDASQAVATFRLPSRALATKWSRFLPFAFIPFLMAAGMFGAHHGPLSAILPLLPFLMLAYVLVLIVPSKVHVGADGLLIEWLRTKRFIPHAEISDVMEYESGYGKSRMSGLDLRLASGEIVRIPVTSKKWGPSATATLRARIDEAREASTGGGVMNEAAVVLGREGRPVLEWITALRAVGAGTNATHRIAPVNPDRLWSLVEDPGTDARARAAAAVALSASTDDEGRTRLRAAAVATAAPKLRIALETAANAASEDELARVLDELEESESARSALL